jgi:hypothetical protein
MQSIKKIFSTLLLFISFISLGMANELNCKVTVNSDQIAGTSKSVFTTLEKSITEFMNERQWTDHEYSVEERIECSMMILVNNYNNGYFNCNIQVNANRPVYGTNYKSPIYSFNDVNFAFNYNENDPLNFDENSFSDNLTAVLAYYAYMIIATDLDTFSSMGGTLIYKKAESIVNQAQSTNTKGWRAFEDGRNRYALITSIVDDIAKPYREYLYTYHRLGLDEMTLSPDKSRNKINDKLTILKEIYKERPSNIIVSEFAETKLDELINVYSKATPTERKNAYDILSYLVPTLQHRMDALK